MHGFNSQSGAGEFSSVLLDLWTCYSLLEISELFNATSENISLYSDHLYTYK